MEAHKAGTGLWRFEVTVENDETGRDKYADGRDVVLPDGRVARANDNDGFTRVLYHPHVNEQPFTRSRSNVAIPVARKSPPAVRRVAADAFVR